ncbi:MAG: SDR family oxidoreductase [Actinobacteria bacterium]|nr:SDR family oxidoreductase [Actinomycetota bacterium]
MNLKNKKLLLTGASTGIGKAIAYSFLKKGAKVIVFGLHKPRYCSSFFKVDLRQRAQIISAISKIGKIDILINNAGVVFPAKIVETKDEIMEEMLDINFKSVFWMSKYAVPKINKSGCIINISSIRGLRGCRGVGVYSATKAAVINFTETLAQELADRKIRVNCIAPGFVKTAIWKKEYGVKADKVRKELEKYTLLKRSAAPEEIAHAAVFLCENEFMEASTLVIDGGIY